MTATSPHAIALHKWLVEPKNDGYNRKREDKLVYPVIKGENSK
jgi:hypothetical protein